MSVVNEVLLIFLAEQSLIRLLKIRFLRVGRGGNIYLNDNR